MTVRLFVVAALALVAACRGSATEGGPPRVDAPAAGSSDAPPVAGVTPSAGTYTVHYIETSSCFARREWDASVEIAVDDDAITFRWSPSPFVCELDDDGTFDCPPRETVNDLRGAGMDAVITIRSDGDVGDFDDDAEHYTATDAATQTCAGADCSSALPGAPCSYTDEIAGERTGP